MAKQKTPRGDRPPPEQSTKPNRSGKPLHVWIPPELREAMDSAAAQNRRPLTTEVIIALEQYLSGIGLWPASGGDKSSARRKTPVPKE